jgi:hypothetical protein
MIIRCNWRFPFKCFKNPVGAWIDGNGREIAPEDLSLLVDDEQSPFANPFLFAIGAILLCDSAFRFKIGKQREMQVTVPCECRMAPVAIDRDPKKLGPVIAKLGKDLVVWLNSRLTGLIEVERHLIAADRTPIGRIEGKNDHLVRKITQRKHLVGRHVEVKSRGTSAGRKNLSHR